MTGLPGIAEVWALLPEARMVGGAVRDMLAGREVADVDFASPLTPGDVMARAKAAGVKAVPTGVAHGTVTLVIGGRGFEVTTLRRDVETDGRHAVVTFTDDWREDAARRDFTINAMSMDRDGTVFDYFGGREDLAAGRVRFVGDPHERIKEDYLRVLRFFRFFARYGGEPDAAAVVAIRALKRGIASLSAERVWSEIKRILAAFDPVAALGLMRETGVLELVIPGAWVERMADMDENGAPVDPLLRVAALLNEDVTGFAERMRLSGAEKERLVMLLDPSQPLSPDDPDIMLRRALALMPTDVVIGRTWLYGDLGPEWSSLRSRIKETERPVFPLRGRDILDLGARPGPDVGKVLEAARKWWLAGGCMDDRNACLAFVKRDPRACRKDEF